MIKFEHFSIEFFKNLFTILNIKHFNEGRVLKIDNSVGTAIKTFRKKARLTQSELAGLLGVSFSTLRRWEAYGGQPRTDELKKLCEVLGCTESELLTNSQDDKVELVLSWNWEEMKKGEINMDINRFKVILGEDGKIGLQGAGMITSRAGIEEFLGRVRNELEIALDAQVRRGVIPQEA